MGKTALTSAEHARAAATKWVHFGSMRLFERDRRILRLVARFGQVSSAHIQSLIFHDVTDSPRKVALRRLVDRDLLALVGKPQSGGPLGGRPTHVYQLGKVGWPLFFEGRPRHSTVVVPHTIGIVDAYVSLKEAERAGHLSVIHYETEPDCHRMIAGADLRPDLYVELGLVKRRKRIGLWIEIDRDSQRQKTIASKLNRYLYVEEHSAESGFDPFPSAIFLALDDERVQELRRYSRGVKTNPEWPIQIDHIDNFPSVLL